MGLLTKIQWCDHTWNPWRGCAKVSPGCLYCYAEAGSVRNPSVLGEWGPHGRRSIAAPRYWNLPIAWDRAAAAAGERRKVFCASLADVFEDNRQVEDARDLLFTTILATPYLDYLLLTKRPENVNRLASSALGWNVRDHGLPPNVWLGVSVESHDWLWRISTLMDIKARVRFLSLEPLLANLCAVVKHVGNLSTFLDSTEPGLCPREVYPFLGLKAIPDHDWDTGKIHWAIIGGESHKNRLTARPCDLLWIAEIVRMCQHYHCPVFVKQLGSHPVLEGQVLHLNDPKGGDPDEWPAAFPAIREFPTPEEAA